MHLRHLHIRNPISYVKSLQLQEAILEKHFAHKTVLRKDAAVKPNPKDVPQPTLLTFQTHPTYTVGRRHLTANPLSQQQISFLTGNSPTARDASENHEANLATFFPSPRGGLLTYHAPGQLTAYLILNLRTHNLTPRCYIRLLENTIVRTCAQHGVPNVMTTDDPGVWIAKKSAQGTQQSANLQDDSCELVGGSQPTLTDLTATDRKICAIGVHVSRGITSHGIGLNVFDSPIEPTTSSASKLYTLPIQNVYTNKATNNNITLDDGTIPAPGYLSWGFSRIVACGLEGKTVTWLSREQNQEQEESNKSYREGRGVGSGDGDRLEGHHSAASSNPSIDAVAQTLALEVTRSLKIENERIESISEADVYGL